jgi:hypothetical protein
VVVECENVLLPSLGKTIKELPFSKKEEWLQLHHIKHVLLYVPFSLRAGWACRIPSVFTQIYLCFSAAEDFVSAMLD